MDCIFCKIAAGEIPSHKVFEDDLIMAFMDIAPVNPGHVLVVPKEHHSSLLDLPDDLLSALAEKVKKISPAVLGAVEAESFNLILNNGLAAGQAVSHCHFHLIPRFAGDGHKSWPGKKYDPGQAEAIAAKIKGGLE